MTLRTKLLVALSTMSILPFLIVGVVTLVHTTKSLSNLAFGQLESMCDVKKAQMINSFTASQKNMGELIETVTMLRQATFQKLQSVQENKKAQIEELVQKWLRDATVISQNALIVDTLESFSSLFQDDGTFDSTMYQFTEEFNLGNSLHLFKEQYGYEDLLIIQRNGRIVYTLNQESDLGQNVLTGDLKDSSLGQCFQRGLQAVVIQDFAAYAPSDNQQIAFVAGPIFKGKDVMGVLVLKITEDPLNAIVQRREGMGETGESYVVGRSDSLTVYRSDRIVQKEEIGSQVFGEGVKHALSGQSGSMISTRNDETLELVSYDSLDLPQLEWGLISSMNLEEAITPRLEGEDEDFFAKYIRQYGYDDLLLIHPDGTVFYSVQHGQEHGTNLFTGDYSESGLAQLVQHTLKSKAFGFSDVEQYIPADGTPAAFIAQPVLQDDTVELIVVLRLSLDAMNVIMRDGSTREQHIAESYLVGPDGLLRSDFSSSSENLSVLAAFEDPDSFRIDTEAFRQAVTGKSFSGIMKNSLGRKVLSSYAPLEFWDTTWVLIAEMDASEAFATIRETQYIMGGIGVVSISVIIVISLLITRHIMMPLKRVVLFVSQISSGNIFEISVENSLDEDCSRQDEIGAIAVALQYMRERIYQVLQEMDSLSQAIQNGNLSYRGNTEGFPGDWRKLLFGVNKVVEAFVPPFAAISSRVDRIVEGDITGEIAEEYQGDFEALKQKVNRMSETLREIVRNVKTAADAVEGNSHEMNDRAMALSQSTTEQAAVTEEISVSMQEMVTTFRQNDENARSTGEIAVKAAEDAERAGKVVVDTVLAMQKIAKKVALIENIALETHMLSLNATIEAAKAQDYGKGFAVVSSEVRSLAARSSEAAKQIGELAASSLDISNQAGRMLNDLVPRIQTTADLVQKIIEAIQEQHISTNHINNALQQLDISTQQNVTTSETVAAIAEELASQSTQLRSMIELFQVDEISLLHEDDESEHAKDVSV